MHRDLRLETTGNRLGPIQGLKRKAVKLIFLKEQILDSPSELRADMEGRSEDADLSGRRNCINGTFPFERARKRSIKSNTGSFFFFGVANIDFFPPGIRAHPLGKLDNHPSI